MLCCFTCIYVCTYLCSVEEKCGKKHEKIEKPKHIIKVIEEFCFARRLLPSLLRASHLEPVILGALLLWPIMMKLSLSTLSRNLWFDIAHSDCSPMMELPPTVNVACSTSEGLRTFTNVYHLGICFATLEPLHLGTCASTFIFL